MTVTAEQKDKIEAEYAAWEAMQYAGLDKTERQKRAAFFTPPQLSMKMLEKFDTVVDKDILDPAAGAGGLLAAAVICGADPNRIYGIELDPKIAKVCRSRLAKLGVPRHHIHVGDALDSTSYEFAAPETSFSIVVSKSTAGILVNISTSRSSVNKTIAISKGKGVDENSLKACHRVIEKLVDLECAADEKTNKNITVLDALFSKFGLSAI